MTHPTIKALRDALKAAKQLFTACSMTKGPVIAKIDSALALADASEGAPKLVAWVEPDGDTWHVHPAESKLGRHISEHQKSTHYVSVFPLFDGPWLHPAEQAKPEPVEHPLRRAFDTSSLEQYTDHVKTWRKVDA